VRALLRRTETVVPTVLRVATWSSTPARLRGAPRGALVPLTAKEFAILEYLMRHAGRLVTRSMLLESCWDASYDGLSNLVDVNLSRLRRKLETGGQTALLTRYAARAWSSKTDRHEALAQPPRTPHRRFLLLALSAVAVAAVAMVLFVEQTTLGTLDGRTAGGGDHPREPRRPPGRPPRHRGARDRQRDRHRARQVVSIVRADGTTVAASRRIPASVARKTPENLAAPKVGTAGEDDAMFRVAWAPTEPAGWWRLASMPRGRCVSSSAARWAIALLAAALLAVLGFGAWTITGRATQELARLADEVATIEAGSLERRLSVRRTDEVDRLWSS